MAHVVLEIGTATLLAAFDHQNDARMPYAFFLKCFDCRYRSERGIPILKKRLKRVRGLMPNNAHILAYRQILRVRRAYRGEDTCDDATDNTRFVDHS